MAAPATKGTGGGRDTWNNYGYCGLVANKPAALWGLDTPGDPRIHFRCEDNHASCLDRVGGKKAKRHADCDGCVLPAALRRETPLQEKIRALRAKLKAEDYPESMINDLVRASLAQRFPQAKGAIPTPLEAIAAMGEDAKVGPAFRRVMEAVRTGIVPSVADVNLAGDAMRKAAPLDDKLKAGLLPIGTAEERIARYQERLARDRSLIAEMSDVPMRLPCAPDCTHSH